jgi:simple sugar transport system permease protein
MAQGLLNGKVSAARQPGEVPAWVGILLLPLLNLIAALALSGLVILVIGENPLLVMPALVQGALGDGEGIGYTLYYATDFIFAGLAVAVAFRCGLFNIGGEGQAYIAGLGVTLVALGLDGWPWPVVAALSILVAALFGAAWAFLPAWLQAKRGSHIVITTIMFNFIAASVMTYLIVEVMIAPHQQSPESRGFDPSTWLPTLDGILGRLGIDMPETPLNIAFFLALLCCAGVHVLIQRTRWGYEIRTVGQNERAAVYAGISPARTIILAMAVSGALAGLVAVNDLLGVHHRLIVGFTGGVGYVGIAVALMGRNHPVGIIVAGILFGALYQGGSELSFDFPSINREMVVVIQGLVILFAGALEQLFKQPVERLFRLRAAPAPARAEG